MGAGALLVQFQGLHQNDIEMVLPKHKPVIATGGAGSQPRIVASSPQGKVEMQRWVCVILCCQVLGI